MGSVILGMLVPVSAVAAEFRSIDGAGNNLGNPGEGAANTRVIRFGYEADYPDGIGDVITAPNKPNPRDVSNTVNAQSGSILNGRGLSDWVVHWGQFLTHDMTLIETDAAANVLSTGATGDFSIPVTAPGDELGPGPIAFDRSVFDPASGQIGDTPRGPGPIPRWQINANTSYIDASNVYGSDTATAASLRTFAGGKLKTSAGGLLPDVDGDGDFLAGDPRANENVGLTAIHTLFVREHNRLADRIAAEDPSLDDEAIYQWARKIVGAEMQAITYGEFLPALMGDAAPAAEDFGYTGVQATITTAFSTAAFRFGHSMQSPELKLADAAGNDAGSVSLRQASENPGLLADDPANVDRLLSGLGQQVAQENDAYVIDELRNILFGPPGAGGTDLAALDIQRGRDHGLLNSNSLHRIAYNLPPIFNFDQLTSDPEVLANLAAVYTSVDRVDPWVAMISEDHLEGSSLGALAQAILISQFTRLRDGDRFFYTGDPDLQDPLVTAVIDLDTFSLGQLLTLNAGLTQVQPNVFFAVPEPGAAAALIFAGAAVPRRRRDR
ncbi:MAG: peroxidase family protein [Planctomycetota bacterium]